MLDPKITLLQAGFWLIPLEAGKKIPLAQYPEWSQFLKLWQTKPDIVTSQLTKIFQLNPHINIGLICHHLLIIDADDTEIQAQCDQHLLTPYIVQTGRGRHYYYQAHPEFTKTKAFPNHQLDIKTGDQAYVVTPPSFHQERRKSYEWINNAPQSVTQIPELSDPELTWLKQTLFEKKEKSTKKKEKPRLDLSLSQVLDFYQVQSGQGHQLCPFPDHADENPSFRVDLSKNCWVCSCSGGGPLQFIARMEGTLAPSQKLEGSNFHTTLAKAREIDPTLDNQFNQYQAQLQDVLDLFNQQYFFLESSGNQVYRVESDGHLVNMSVANFRASRANELVNNMSTADLWLMSPFRKTYHRLVFKPASPCEPLEYNRFKGWPLIPIKGSHAVLDYHLKEVLCSGNNLIYEWLMDWLADMFQHPESEVKTSIGLKGPQGIGKSLFYKLIKQLMGQYAMVAESVEDVTGRFNDYLQNKLLIFFEEAIWGGSIRDANRLKHRITGDKLWIEIKGGARYEIKNVLRYMAVSNEEHFLHLDQDDRRWLILEVSAKHKKDGTYFNKLARAIETEAPMFLYTMLTRSIQANLNLVPDTQAKISLKSLSLNPIMAWWFHCLIEGQIQLLEQSLTVVLIDFESWRRGTVTVNTQNLYRAFTQGLTLSKHPGAVSFGMQFRKLLFGEIRRIRQVDGWHYSLPNLEICQGYFAKLTEHSWTDLTRHLITPQDQITTTKSCTLPF